MSKLQNPVLMAIIGSAHGTDGKVRVKTFTGHPMALDDYGVLYDKRGKSYQVESLRLQKTAVIVHFKGIDTRTLAETLNGTELFIDRARLPDDLEKDEFYQDDLIGFTAFDADGREIGCVTAFFNFGGGDLLELAVKDKENQLIPFSRSAVPHIDMIAGRIVVDPVAAGLGADEDERAQEV